MSVAGHAATTVTTSITRVTTALSNGNDARLLRNVSASVDCYLGDAAVTTGSGFPLKAGETISIVPGPLEIYGRTASSTADIRAIGG